MAETCKVRSCHAPVVPPLEDQELCLDHFLSDVSERCGSYSRQLETQGATKTLREIATQFIVSAAAKIATIGMNNPPDSQLTRGRLLHAMLLLAELRERFDKAAPRESPAK